MEQNLTLQLAVYTTCNCYSLSYFTKMAQQQQQTDFDQGKNY